MVIAYGSIIGLAGGAQTAPEFMTYDPAERLVQLTVVARYDDTHSGYNLNGGYYGSHRITVPLGWRVRVAFINHDVVPHSLGIVREGKLAPVRIEKPALSGAATRAIVSGIPAHARDAFAFQATRPGAYLLACGVPGHAAIGGYLRFTISEGATVPTYESSATIARSRVRH